MAEEPLDAAVSPEFFFNGLRDLHIEHDVFKCTLFSLQKVAGQDRIVEVARLACPAVQLPDIINQIVTSVTNAARIAVRVPARDGH